MIEDSELIRRYAEDRSEEAFAELVRRHLNLVYSAACRQVGGDVHRARDVTQMVFADLARKASGLAGHTALVGWLYTSTHFTAAKIRRGEQRRAAREKEAHAMHELLNASAEPVDWERVRPVLDATMHELKAGDREALLLRFFEQRSFADVGRQLGLGENAARMRVERALEKLGGLLSRHGITSSGAALSLVLVSQAVGAAPAGMAGAVASGALLQAAAGGGVAGVGAAVAQLMANTKLVLGATGLAAAITLGTGLFYATQAARAETAGAEMWRETDELRARLREASRRRADGGAASAQATALVRPAPAGPEAEETGVDRATRALMNDPESIRLRAQRDRLAASRKFGMLYRELGWNAAHVAQFETMLEAAVAEDFRAQGGAKLKGREMALGPDIMARIDEIRAKFEDDVRRAFGDLALQRFLAAERMGDAREIATEIAGRVHFSDTPLTGGQASALMEILMACSPQHAVGEPVARSTLDWEQVLRRAREALPPAQFNALQAIRAKVELETRRHAVMFPEPKP